MPYIDNREEKWLILFEDDGDPIRAHARQLLSYFHDWQSWLSLFASMHTGEAAEMTMHGADKVTRCKIILLSQASSGSTFADPLGLTQNRYQGRS